MFVTVLSAVGVVVHTVYCMCNLYIYLIALIVVLRARTGLNFLVRMAHNLQLLQPTLPLQYNRSRRREKNGPLYYKIMHRGRGEKGGC